MNPSLRRLLLICIPQVFFLCFAFGQSYQFEWVRHFGATGQSTNPVSILIDSNKSVIVAGNFRNTVDFDAGPGVFNLTANGPQNIFITEYDSAGNFKWAEMIGGTIGDDVRDIKFDRNGNLLLLGYIQGTVDMDPGPGVFNVTSVGATTFLLKLDNNGNFTWVQHFLSYDMNVLDIDRSNNIIIGGDFNGTVDFDPGPAVQNLTAGLIYPDLFVLKLDNSGNFIWAKQMQSLGTGYFQQFGLESDSDNSIYFAGNFSVSADFDPGPGISALTSNGLDDAYLLKLDASGNFVWVKQLGGPGTDKIWGMQIDEADNVYTTGIFENTLDFDPGPASYLLSASPGKYSCFVSKLDKTGNFVYAKAIQNGSSGGLSIALDRDRNVYVAGNFSGPIDFDPGPGTYNVTATGDLYTFKLDQDGNFAWAATYDTQVLGSYLSIYSGLAVDVFKNVYLASDFPFTVDFDPGPSTFNVTPIGNWDVCIVKLSQCKNSVNSITAEACSSYTLNSTTYTSTGVYYQTLPGSTTACDSIIQLNLTIKNSFNQSSVTSCDSYLWNGTLLTSSGIYKDTFHLASGCDSIVQLDLTITKILKQTSLSACGSYLWNGILQTSSGIYSDTFHLANGCDSIVALNLTVNSLPSPNLGKDSSICDNQPVLLTPGTFNGYLWNDNSTASSLTITAPGTYSVKVTDNNNCAASDTIIIKHSDACGSDCDLTIDTKLYPNPFGSSLVIQKNTTTCVVRMNLYNALGQLLIKDELISDGKNNINFSRFAAGVYFYRFYSDGKILLTGRIVKQ